jgi:hypothetical protein
MLLWLKDLVMRWEGLWGKSTRVPVQSPQLPGFTLQWKQSLSTGKPGEASMDLDNHSWSGILATTGWNSLRDWQCQQLRAALFSSCIHREAISWPKQSPHPLKLVWLAGATDGNRQLRAKAHFWLLLSRSLTTSLCLPKPHFFLITKGKY